MKKIIILVALCLSLTGCVVYAPPAMVSASVAIPAPVVYPPAIIPPPPVYHRPLFLPPPPPRFHHRPHYHRPHHPYHR